MNTSIENSCPLVRPSVDELVADLGRLPSEQGLYHRILDELRDPNGTLEHVGMLVGSDPGISVEVIRTVNSAAFGYPRTISDPIDSVMLLGGDQVLALVLMIEVFSIQEGVDCPGFSFGGLLSHCRIVAWNARGLMRQQSSDRVEIGAAFTAGLLHDVGKLLLAANFPDRYGGCTNEASEYEVFDANHSEIGAAFLRRWQMPEMIVEAVANHARLRDSADPKMTIAEAVYVANAQAHYKLQTSPSSRTLPEQVDAMNERFGDKQTAAWGFK